MSLHVLDRVRTRTALSDRSWPPEGCSHRGKAFLRPECRWNMGVIQREGFRAKASQTDLAVTFRDLILLPGWTEVEPSQVELSSQATLHHSINIPFISSPMDTVTESDMAIALASIAGFGVLHRNCTAEEEEEMAREVKLAASLIIKDVIIIRCAVTV